MQYQLPQAMNRVFCCYFILTEGLGFKRFGRRIIFSLVQPSTVDDAQVDEELPPFSKCLLPTSRIVGKTILFSPNKHRIFWACGL